VPIFNLSFQQLVTGDIKKGENDRPKVKRRAIIILKREVFRYIDIREIHIHKRGRRRIAPPIENLMVLKVGSESKVTGMNTLRSTCHLDEATVYRITRWVQPRRGCETKRNRSGVTWLDSDGITVDVNSGEAEHCGNWFSCGEARVLSNNILSRNENMAISQV
jgi:hypothetical protein